METSATNMFSDNLKELTLTLTRDRDEEEEEEKISPVERSWRQVGRFPGKAATRGRRGPGESSLHNKRLDAWWQLIWLVTKRSRV